MEESDPFVVKDWKENAPLYDCNDVVSIPGSDPDPLDINRGLITVSVWMNPGSFGELLVKISAFENCSKKIPCFNKIHF